MKTKSLYLAVALGMMLGFSSCNLDTFPSDELQSDALLQDVKGAEYIMDTIPVAIILARLQLFTILLGQLSPFLILTTFPLEVFIMLTLEDNGIGFCLNHIIVQRNSHIVKGSFCFKARHFLLCVRH